MNDLDLLSAAVDPVDPPTDAVRTDARARLDAMVAAQVRSDVIRLPETARRRRGVVWTAAAAIVVTLVVAVTVVLPRTEQATASGFLREMSVISSERSFTPVPSDAFVYVKTSTSVTTPDAKTEWEREEWISPTGEGRIVDRSGDQRYGLAELEFIDASELPTDPDELERWLREDESQGRVSTDTNLLLKIGTYLGGTVAPPDVRRALYLVASRIHGTELEPDVVDAAGRPGSAVVLDGPRQDVELVIDPDTAELLSQSESITLDGVDVRGETTTYLEVGVVDSTDERP